MKLVRSVFVISLTVGAQDVEVLDRYQKYDWLLFTPDLQAVSGNAPTKLMRNWVRDGVTHL
jgi:hypothetical protein